MTSVNRIPDCSDFSFDGMLCWFAELSRQDLLFHPDEDPAEIFSVDGGIQMFSSEEVRSLENILGTMYKLNGDKVYDAAYPIFMKRMGLKLDA